MKVVQMGEVVRMEGWGGRGGGIQSVALVGEAVGLKEEVVTALVAWRCGGGGRSGLGGDDGGCKGGGRVGGVDGVGAERVRWQWWTSRGC